MFKKSMKLKLIPLMLAAATTAPAQQITIDATAPIASPETGFIKMGANTSPSGQTIGVNSQYLTLNGKPWLPIMGEFHYSRYPEELWERELLKMKAGGVQIVASYVIWIHHEEVEGTFDWSGQRNLRRFVELAQKHGLYAYPRIGPWSHAEVRNGGFPDWLVRKVGERVRSNDSTYLAYVDRFYKQIAEQLRGLLWKEGGPVIGIQLENEYNQRGEGRDEAHIVRLKELARNAGFDVPLYTVTGWDATVVPPGEVIPVFGGYADMPWDQSNEELPPSEVYAFRFENRWSGSSTYEHTTHKALARYPFLGAEYGPGIQITYHRRPVISSDDVAAMLPVQIGSGVNLYGYYMFHGGTNPRGQLTTLQESQRTGYPTDVPVKSYDFQAPLGEFGVMRESFRKIKLVHYFLNEFGHDLAPMIVRQPERIPASTADTTVLRVSARTSGNRGYVFVNNHLRNYPMPPRKDVQITLRLPNETLRIPQAPIDIPTGAYFIWPVNFDVSGATLKYSTAQVLTRVVAGVSQVYFFFEVPGVPAEFVFDAATIASLDAPVAHVARANGRITVRRLQPGLHQAIGLRTTSGNQVRIVLLSHQQAQNAWRPQISGADRLLVADDDVYFAGDTTYFRSFGEPEFTFSMFPAFESSVQPQGITRTQTAGGLFTRYTAAVPVRNVALEVVKQRDAGRVPPVKLFNAVTWRKVEIALAPSDSAFDDAARYQINVPDSVLVGVDDVVLEITYVGDVARLYSRGELLNDNFFNGTPWRISLKRYAEAVRRGPLELRILPLRSDAPIYIPSTHRPAVFPESGQVADLRAMRVIPVYLLQVMP
jgi:beta-galactosidase